MPPKKRKKFPSKKNKKKMQNCLKKFNKNAQYKNVFKFIYNSLTGKTKMYYNYYNFYFFVCF